MSFDTPFVEYLIIGTHTFSWMIFLLGSVFKLPPKFLGEIDAGTALLFLPIIYLLGMLFDSLYQAILNRFRLKIRDQIINYPKYKDEFLALESPTLYAAYEVRMRRIRVIGAAIFNWPLLAVSLIIYLGIDSLENAAFIAIAAVLLCAACIFAWRGLYARAYDFRKSAIDEIRKKNQLDDRNVKK